MWDGALQRRLRALPQLPRAADGCLPRRQSGPCRRRYGYVDMGGWTGGQAGFALVPYADFNLVRYPDKAQALSASSI